MGPDLPQQEHLARLFLRGSMVTLISFLGLSVISTVRKRKPLIGHNLRSRFLIVMASGMVVFFDHLTYQIRSSSQMFIFPQWCFLPTDFAEEAKFMASQQQLNTELSRVFFSDITNLYPQSQRQYDCTGISKILCLSPSHEVWLQLS